MKYRTNISLGEVGWKYYLDSSINYRSKRFLKISGNEVLGQLHSNIKRSIINNSPRLEILLHPNVSSVTIIKDSEYKEVLNFCLNWFMENEDYEKCSEVIKTKEMLCESNKDNSLVLTKNK